MFYDHSIKFTFHHGRRWTSQEVAYIALWAIFGYLLLPTGFASTGSYHNWTILLDPRNLTVLFLACIAMGVWDELFFVNTVLGLFRRYLPFIWANLLQAAVFTTFL